MLDRLAAAGAGGESLANEVDQLRSQVRFSLFFSMPVLFLFRLRFRSLFLSLSFTFSLREGFGFSQCAHAEMEHLGLIWGGGGGKEKRSSEEEGRAALAPSLRHVGFFFFSPNRFDVALPPPLLSSNANLTLDR